MIKKKPLQITFHKFQYEEGDFSDKKQCKYIIKNLRKLLLILIWESFILSKILT